MNCELFLILISCFFLLQACASCKETAYRQEWHGRDSLYAGEKDSFALQSILRSSARKHLRIRRVDLSEPDSLRRQHVRSVTFLETISRTEKESETTAQHSAQLYLESVQEGMRTEHVRQEKKKEAGWPVYACALIFICGGVLVSLNRIA